MQSRVIIFILLLYSVFRFVFPLDIPFINDEALLLQRALDDNLEGRFTVSGLMGSRGLDYGPFAIWFYRLVFLFTKSAKGMVFSKMVFIYLMTIGSLYWIGKRAKLPVSSLVALALLSPYLWFYSRDLWDNSFVIPLSAAFFAAYFDFILVKRYKSLALAVFFLSLGFLTHLVFMPLLAAFVVHFLVFEFKFFKQNLSKVLSLGVFSLALVSPYLFHALKQRPTHHLEMGDLGHLLMPFTGARFFTSLGLEYFLGATWLNPFEVEGMNIVWNLGTAFSVLAYPLFLYGLYQMVLDVNRRPFYRVILLSLFFQIVLSFMYRLIPIPNFHSAQWIVYLLSISKSIETLSQRRWVLYPYLASLALAIPMFLALVHTHNGSRFIHYGPTLGNQLQIARQLSQLETKEILREAFHVVQFPFALEVLKRLENRPMSKVVVSSVRIRYEKPQDPKNGRIQLETSE